MCAALLYKPQLSILYVLCHSAAALPAFSSAAASVHWRPALLSPSFLCLLPIQTQVPTAHGKADLTLYRSDGRKVLGILARLAKTERASIDE